MSDLAADPRSLLLRSAPRLVSGAGRYVANLAPTGALSVVLVRSALAHARILGIDAAKARSLPGVVGVFVLSDLESWGVGELPIGWIVPGQKARANKVLAGGRVRHVGEPVAAVVAESPALAEDAAGLVEISYAPLPAVSDVEQALLPSAPVLHEEWGRTSSRGRASTRGTPSKPSKKPPSWSLTTFAWAESPASPWSRVERPRRTTPWPTRSPS